MDLITDYRRKIIANSPHLSSASGAVVTFADGTDLPLKSLNVGIEPVQSGTGDPSPTNVRAISGWDAVNVTRCGKNLFSLDTLNVNAVTDFTINPIPPGTYIFSAVITSTDTDGTKSTIVFKNANGASLVSKAMTRGDRQYTTAFTVNSPITKITCYAGGGYPSSQGDTAIFSECMITAGNTATPYEPYQGQSVTVQLGETVYGGTLNPLTGVLTAYPYYASYNGETLTGRWVSDRDKYVAGTTPTIGAQVVDMSGTGTTYNLTPQQIRTLYGNNTIFADTGNVALEYWAHA